MSNPLERLKQKFKARVEKEEVSATASIDLQPADSSILPDLSIIVEKLDPSKPIDQSQRAQSITELADAVQKFNLSSEIEDLWQLVVPFTKISNSEAVRHGALGFARACVLSNTSYSDLFRASLFKTVVSEEWGSEHLGVRIQTLRDLAKDGRDLRELELDVGQKLCEWTTQFADFNLEAKVGASVPTTVASAPASDHMTPDIASTRQLLALITNVMKFSFLSLRESHVAHLVVTACSMASRTTAIELVHDVLLLLDGVVRYGSVPMAALRPVIEMLSYTVNLAAYTQESWQVMRNLLKSHRARHAMDHLCRIIDGISSSEQALQLRGAVFMVAMASWGAQRVKNLSYPYMYLLPYLRRATRLGDKDVNTEVLLSIQRLISENGEELSRVEWELLLDILREMSKHFVVDAPGRPCQISGTNAKSWSEFAAPSPLFFDLFNEVLISLKDVCLEQAGPMSLAFLELLLSFGPYLTETTVLSLLEHAFGVSSYAAFSERVAIISRIQSVFFFREHRQSIRMRMLQLLIDAFVMSSQEEQEEIFEVLLQPIMRHLPREEAQSPVYYEMISCLARVAPGSAEKHVVSVVEALVQCALNTESDAIASVLMLAELLSAMATQSTVAVNPGTGTLTADMSLRALHATLEIFERCAMEHGGKGCLLIFKYLVRIPTFHAAPHFVRLACLQYLLKMRADALYRILLRPTSRTVQKGEQEMRATKGSSDDSSGETFSNTDDLEICSSLFCSGKPNNEITDMHEKSADPQSAERSESDICILPIAQHTAALLLILTREKNWEIYSFVLQNLATQLLNLHFFQNAGPQLSVLRAFLCELIINERAAATVLDLPPSVRKSDVYLSALKMLNILLAYRHFFTKQDEDEILAAFQTGLYRWPNAAKTCIHAFTLTLLELPHSMMKLLPGTLLKVSQMMSSAMAVHNLEFLATLAGLPKLRVNFTDVDMKRVFVIALQYINTTNSASPAATTSALSSYVVQLAYQVLLAWFVSLKLPERKKYVPFIIHYLLLGNDRRASLDENIELVLDMLIHHSFADCWPKPDDTMYQGSKINKQPSRTWAQGNSLLTVQVSNQPGWANVIIRRPSGVISFSVRLDNRLKSVTTPLVPLLAPVAFEKISRGLRASQSKRAVASDDGAGAQSLRRSDSDGSSHQHVRRHMRSVSVASLSSIPNTSEFPMAIETPRMRSETGLSASPADSTSSEFFVEEVSGGLRRARSTSMSSVVIPDGIDMKTSVPSPRYERNEEGLLSTSPSARDLKSSALSAIRNREDHHLVDPSFILAQFVAYPNLAARENLYLLPNDESTRRALSVLDRTPVVDLHKIGVVYVGPGQQTEAEILANGHGSRAYGLFLQSLGRLVRLKGCRDVYTGGLDTSEDLDGRHAIYAHDDLSQIIFHCTTLMPTSPYDPLCTSKKRHIGNDFVTIVWNESGKEYAFDTIPAQFNFVNIIIEPAGRHKEDGITTPSNMHGGQGHHISDRCKTYQREFFKVVAKLRPDMPEIGPLSEPKLVTGASLAPFVRQSAVHTNIFSQIFLQSGNANHHTSNARERLRQIKRIKERAEGSASAAPAAGGADGGEKGGGSGGDFNVGGRNVTTGGWESLLDFTRFI
ncbi:uncharacterized protein SPPG_01788 [Spizellomyces punctatus DAOM BR117]|uniref:Rap-GAP domain-containing protein n=1 Tax=Spizellomyces punctatus (strain DAOM BR117) TaxID=645134 RepID=A0A0L0HP23_SPIPD|nr:uncharacterized protein SPPG_01788 [Spizellomyces punctatus DAOM BR117]KND02705.1 hypothetical protein SPPG_01788 [Spizellomyces punctatus DAOM BR117]|eukprot:XP_016610744.1 hypothetical protein SPPG_01788 [Spizellomyces punctatus DAOM BR117]